MDPLILNILRHSNQHVDKSDKKKKQKVELKFDERVTIAELKQKFKRSFNGCCIEKERYGNKMGWRRRR